MKHENIKAASLDLDDKSNENLKFLTDFQLYKNWYSSYIFNISLMLISLAKVNELNSLTTRSLSMLYELDLSLIKRHAHERSIVFRFGLYFCSLFRGSSFGSDPDLTIDFDYNRNGYNSKTMAGFNAAHGVFPDLIVHRREYNNKNLVAMEFKGHWNDTGRDHEKLCGFTHQLNNQYHFGMGIFIVLGRTPAECSVVNYIDGKVETVICPCL